jgi:hypothetical protein
MALELIPVLLFAWLVELTQLIQANAGLLFFLPLFAIVWTVGVISIMRRWDGR